MTQGRLLLAAGGVAALTAAGWMASARRLRARTAQLAQAEWRAEYDGLTGLLTVTDRIAAPKNPENRAKLHTNWRGELFIHSGQIWDPAGAQAARDHGLYLTDSEVATGYIGVAELVDVHHADDDTCRCDPTWAEPGAWHWVLDNVRPFKFAVPLPGRQGLFRLDGLVVDQLDVLLGAT